ncbi:Methyl sulfide methyltransferase-associated sensor [uncultured archaeon]|nr:Methyl sulfide methyltransferase-associated sensor [uncultured archaeon]
MGEIYIRDIKKRKQAEVEREQFYKFFQISSDIMVIADPNGAFKKVNPATFDVLGYSETELISKPFVEFVHPDDKQSTLDEMARQIKIGSSLNFENRYVCKDGTLRWLSWRARYDKKEGITYATARDITDHKHAEKSLSRMASILENTPDFVSTADVNGNVLYMNSGARKMLGIEEKGDISQFRISDAHPEWASALVKNVGFPTAIRDGFWSGETALVNRDGREIPVLQMILAHKANDGSVEFYSTIMRDITERKRAEEALQESEIRYRRLFEAAHDGILILDIDTGQITDVNPFMIDILGYSHEEFLGKKLWEIGLSKDIETSKAAFFELQTKGYVRYEDLPLETKDGRSIDFEIVSNVYLVNHEKVIQCNIRDITERKQVEKELKKYRENLEDLVKGRTAELQLEIDRRKRVEEEILIEKAFTDTTVDSVPGIFYVLDNLGRFIRWNKAFEEITGHSAEEMRGMNALQVIHEDDRELIAKKIQEVFQEGFSEVESLFITRNEVRNYLLTGRRMVIGKKMYLVGCGVDITERILAEESLKLAKEEAENANMVKTNFLHTMSHELRTPLNAILGFSGLLKLKTTGELNEKQERFIDNIITGGNKLLNIISQILDVVKMDEGTLGLCIEKISVPETVDEVIGVIKEKAAAKNVVLEKILDPQLKQIEGDKQKLKQVFINLLDNAVKFSKEGGGTVTITAKKEGDMAKFSITDTGIGIRKEDVSKLFQKFTQLDSGTTRKYGGSGIGLAISKQFVEAHGGKIRAESEYGVGSTFTFMLPLVAKNEEK